jgi:hypothetical protein
MLALVWQVWQRLTSMRHGSVMDCFQQINEHMQERYALRYRGERRGFFSGGHDLPWRQRRRLDRYSLAFYLVDRYWLGLYSVDRCSLASDAQ